MTNLTRACVQELLSPFGQVIPNLAVLGSEWMIDVFFAPHPGITPNFAELGDLAQMTTQLYRLLPGLQTIVVAIEELPRVPETLRLRLLGKGRTQEEAIE